MSLVSTPIVAARVAAPKKAVRKTVTAKASASETAKSQAVAGALALTMLAQPAFAMSELGQIADGDKSAAAKSLAEAEFAELLAKKKAPAPVKKTKNLAVGLPSFSAPPSPPPLLPSGGASKSAPKAKAAPAAPVEKIEVRSRRDKPSTARTPCRTPANQTQNPTNPPKPGRLAASKTRRIFYPREESQLKPDPSPFPPLVPRAPAPSASRWWFCSPPSSPSPASPSRPSSAWSPRRPKARTSSPRTPHGLLSGGRRAAKVRGEWTRGGRSAAPARVSGCRRLGKRDEEATRNVDDVGSNSATRRLDEEK